MIKARSIIVNILVITAVSLALIWGDTYRRQRSGYGEGERAMARGDYLAAVAGYEAAIHMYTPLSPLVERSAERLWSIGERLERVGDRERALIAYRALRSSYYAVGWLLTPGREWIARCDGKIAELTR